MGVSFEWDRRKAAANQRKHGVTFAEAIPVFVAPLARIFDDPGHSAIERRELIVGHDGRRRLLMVAFVQRGPRVRIISARRATLQERERTMKKAPRRQVASSEPPMRREYRLDYQEAKANRFVGQVPREAVAVVLDPDVGSVFGTSDSVNAFLRSAIKTMPSRAGNRRKAG